MAPDDASQWAVGAPVPRTIGRIAVALLVVVVAASVLHRCGSNGGSSSGTSGTPGTAFDRNSAQITLSGSVVVLSSSAKATDVIVVTQENHGSDLERRLARVRFTPDGSDERWHSDPIDDDASRAEIAVVGDTVFAGIDDRLLALDASTGERRWSARLSDKVTTGCERCFAAVGGHLVVRTTDAYVTSFAPGSEEPAWTRRLRSPQGSISVVGGRLFVVDEPESDDLVTAVQTVDPATGKTLRNVSPTCEPTNDLPWSIELSPGDEVRAIPGAGDVVAVFGFGETCVARWNPGTGAIRWSVPVPDAGSVSQDTVVVGRGDVAFADSSSSIASVDLATNAVHHLEVPLDTTAEPAHIAGRTLIAATATTRGTPKRGLAAWDLATGGRRWAVRLAGDPQLAAPDPYSSSDALFDDQRRVVLVPDGDGLRLLTFDGEQRTVAASTLDLATGAVGGGTRRGFLSRYDSGTPSLTVEAVLADRVLVSIDTALQALPPAGSGTFVGFPDGD